MGTQPRLLHAYPHICFLGQSCLENRVTLAMGTGPRLRTASKTPQAESMKHKLSPALPTSPGSQGFSLPRIPGWDSKLLPQGYSTAKPIQGQSTPRPLSWGVREQTRVLPRSRVLGTQ